MSKDIAVVDVRTRTKEEACWALWRAEHIYLLSRGWDSLVPGYEDGRFMIAPGVDYRAKDAIIYTHEDALKIQKEADAEK